MQDDDDDDDDSDEDHDDHAGGLMKILSSMNLIMGE